jgi:hypothetical protein
VLEHSKLEFPSSDMRKELKELEMLFSYTNINHKENIFILTKYVTYDFNTDNVLLPLEVKRITQIGIHLFSICVIYDFSYVINLCTYKCIPLLTALHALRNYFPFT